MKKVLFLIFLIFNSCMEDTFQEEIYNSKEDEIIFSKRTNNLVEFDLPIDVDDNFIWGINGHNGDGNPDYVQNVSINKEIELLKQHQITHYRIDVHTNNLGLVTSNNQRFTDFINNNEGIEIIPVISIRNFFNYNLDNENSSYSKGYNLGRGFAINYGNKIDYYSIGNEEELLITLNNYDGCSASHYDLNKLKVLASFYRGAIEGIKSVDSNSKIIIDSSGYCKWVYYSLLDNYGVNYDIIGYHWYSDMGSLLGMNFYGYNVLEELANFVGKDVWITEINQSNGTFIYNEIQQSSWMKQYIKELDGYYNVKAFFIYELFDQPNLQLWNGASEGEKHYGIVSNNQIIYYKNVSKVLKFEIEEAKYGYEDYIYKLYYSLCERPPFQNESGYFYWLNRLRNLKDPLLINNEFYRDGGLKTFIKNQYLILLETTNDTNGELYWLNQMQNYQLSRESLIKQFCLSDQFWNLSNNNNYDYVKRLYIKLYGSEYGNDIVGIQFWTNQLNSGRPKIDLINIIMKTENYQKRVIKEIYSKLFDQNISEIELNYYLSQFQNNNMNQENLIKKLLLTQKYWENVIKSGYNRRMLIHGYQY